MSALLLSVLSASLLFIPLLSFAGAGGFTTGGIGTTGSQFLLEDIGARGIAMGGAFTAVSDGADSIYWNPAGLARVPRFSAELMYAPYIAGINYQSGEVAQRYEEDSVVAAGFRYQNYGSVAQTDQTGANLGTFTPSDYVAEIGWGQHVRDMSTENMDMLVGAAIRLIHSDYLAQANGYGGDIGGQMIFHNGPFPYELGFTAQNIGNGQKFDTTREVLPFRAKVGGAIHPVDGLALSLDAVVPESNVAYGAAGVEYAVKISDNFGGALRGGFDSLNINSLGILACVSGGAGLTFGNFSFDYAFTPFGVLDGVVHRFSISYKLSGSSRASSEKQAPWSL